MMKNPTSNGPVLAPPGAGLPAFERVIGGAVFALRRRFGSKKGFTAQFRNERETIARLVGAGGETALRRRVLIPRLRGLEDSSRFWSVYMTLDHLRIVNNDITRVIADLARGRAPEGKVSTAAVKPTPDTGPEVVAAYEASCESFLALIGSHPSLSTSVRYAHPWFGPLDAAGWHAMAAVHMGIHRAQIARILANLEPTPA